MIYFGRDGITYRVPATGGDPVPISDRVENRLQLYQDALPDGRGLLPTLFEGTPATSRIAVVAMDLAKPARVFLYLTGEPRNATMSARPPSRHGAEGHGPPMPIGYTLDPDHPVVFVKAWGVLAERDVVAVAAALRSDPRVSPGWATLADTRDVEDIRVGGSLIRGYSSALAPTARARVARAPRGDRASRSGR
jgi:hypothetical protein